MKAVLVLDEMPENCVKCRFSDFGRCLCSALYIRLSVNGRPKECPLRLLPNKLELKKQEEWLGDIDRYEIGFNTCLKEITEGTE